MSGARAKVTGHCTNVPMDHLVISMLLEQATLRA